MHRIIWGLMVSSVLLSSCRLFNKEARTEKKEAVWRGTLAGTMAQRVEFETMELSGKARYEAPGGEGISGLSVSYRITIAKDSLMLIRVSKFIEAAKILIDQDSIRILDKLGNNYMVCDYSLAESYTGLKADFRTLQDMVLGHFLPIPKDLTPEELNAFPQVFQGEAQGTSFRYFIDPLMLKLLRFEADNPERNQRAAVEYTQFEEQGNTQMPMTIGIATFAPDTAMIRLEHRKVNINPSSPKFNFNVPSSYTRTGCDF